MRIVYTIKEGKIFITAQDEDIEIKKMVKVHNHCMPVISFFHMKGNIQYKMSSLFNATPEKGVIISIQFLEHNSCLQFESRPCWKMNFSPTVMSIQLMLTSLPFQHSYENSGNINRFDIFIPQAKAASLIKHSLLNRLKAREILNLCEEKNNLSKRRTKEALHQVIKELEKPTSKSFCTHVEKFIQSVNV